MADGCHGTNSLRPPPSCALFELARRSVQQPRAGALADRRRAVDAVAAAGVDILR